MLLENKTFKKFGHWPKDLSNGSHKKILYKCQDCPKEIQTTYKNYNTFKGKRCRKCETTFRKLSIDMRGKKFNNLTVLNEKSVLINEKVHWKVQCKCGKIRLLQANKLKTVKHCSNKCEKIKRPNKVKGIISGQHWSIIKNSAKIRNLEFKITKNYIEYLYKKQNKKCALSGININPRSPYGSRSKQTALLDRIDSAKGYVKGNVQWIHKKINLMKNNLRENEFFRYCRKVSNYQKENRK